MPVLVTAADAAFGRSLVGALLQQGGEVRAYATGQGDTGSLRAEGAIVATGQLDDEGRLDAAMTDAHTVVHAVVPWLTGSAAQYEHHARVVLTAAQAAEVRRLIVLSVPGADPHADDPLRTVCGSVEALAAAAPLPTITVRTSLIDLPVLRDVLATISLTETESVTEVAPVRLDDVIAGIVALDAARSTAQVGHAVFLADGEPMSLGEYAQRVGAGPRELVGRVYTPPERVPLLRPSLAGPWVNEAGDGADLWDFADVRPRPVGP